jgi:hypothetical protein
LTSGPQPRRGRLTTKQKSEGKQTGEKKEHGHAQNNAVKLK